MNDKADYAVLSTGTTGLSTRFLFCNRTLEEAAQMCVHLRNLNSHLKLGLFKQPWGEKIPEATIERYTTPERLAS